MSDQGYRPPQFRTILIAGIIFAIILVLFWLLSDTLKFIGAPFLYLPNQLGIVRQVQSAEIHTIDLASGPITIDIVQPGRYLVFTGNYKLLQANALLNERAKPWLIVRSLNTSRPIMLTSVERGLRPYDTPLTRGRPIFAFGIETPGAYEFTYPVQNAIIALVPDYTTGNELTITLVYAFQIVVIGLFLGAVSYYRRRGFRAWKRELNYLQTQRRTHSETFWQNEIRRIEEDQERKR